jgi:hypothetical protein
MNDLDALVRRTLHSYFDASDLVETSIDVSALPIVSRSAIGAELSNVSAPSAPVWDDLEQREGGVSESELVTSHLYRGRSILVGLSLLALIAGTVMAIVVSRAPAERARTSPQSPTAGGIEDPNGVEYTVPKGASVGQQCRLEHRARGESTIQIVDSGTGVDTAVPVSVWCDELESVYPPEGLPAKAGLGGETVLMDGHVRIRYYDLRAAADKPPTYISDAEAQRRMEAAR